MGDFISLLLVLGVFALLIAGAYVLAAKLGMLAPRKPAAMSRDDADETPDASDPPVPYCLRSEVLSQAEARLYATITQSLPLLCAALNRADLPLLLMKVRLADIVKIDANKVRAEATVIEKRPRSVQQSAQNRINEKHVDFLLVAPPGPNSTQPFAPRLIIELDDATHARPDRIDRDAFVDRVCAEAGIAILHVPTAGPLMLDATKLAEAMRAALAAHDGRSAASALARRP